MVQTGLSDLIPATTYVPTQLPCSIIGPARLNFRVRDGNGCDPRGLITGNSGGWKLEAGIASQAQRSRFQARRMTASLTTELAGIQVRLEAERTAYLLWL
jgi:hypothetical protein